MQDRCTICWSPITVGANTPVRGSFGLSNGGVAAAGVAMAGQAISCVAETAIAANLDSNDYIIIPNGEVAAAAATAGTAVVVQGIDKYCGRYLNTDALLLDATVCSRVTPFTLSVFTDGFEAVGLTAAVAMATANEASAGALLTPTGKEHKQEAQCAQKGGRLLVFVICGFIKKCLPNSNIILQIYHGKSFKMRHVTSLYFNFSVRYS